MLVVVDMMEVAVVMVYEANEVRWWFWEAVFSVYVRDILKKMSLYN